MFTKVILPLLLLATSLFLSCDGEPVDPNATEIVFFNGKIYTVNDNQPWADAIYVKSLLGVFSIS